MSHEKIKVNDIYMENGYLNADYIIKHSNTFCFILGGRGIGKSFNFLNYARQNGKKFVYIRRQQIQIDLLTSKEFNPFKSINTIFGCNIQAIPQKNSKYSSFYNCLVDEDGLKPYGDELGVALSLSTIKNIRSLDFSDTDLIIFDEFIKSLNEKPIKNEFFNFIDGYETINRNRELENKPAVKAIFLSNSNTLDNDYFCSLNIVLDIEKMIRKGKQLFNDDERKLTLLLVKNSPISKKKKLTSLYRLIGENSIYSDMSVNNEFSSDDNSYIHSEDLKNYNILYKIGELYVYQHKTEYKFYLSSYAKNKHVKKTFNINKKDLTIFVNDYIDLRVDYFESHVFFESVYCELLFKKYFNL